MRTSPRPRYLEIAGKASFFHQFCHSCGSSFLLILPACSTLAPPCSFQEERETKRNPFHLIFSFVFLFIHFYFRPLFFHVCSVPSLVFPLPLLDSFKENEEREKKKEKKGENKTKQNKTKQNKTKQNKTKQNKTKQNKTKQNKTKQNKTRQSKTKQNITEQNKTKQNNNVIFRSEGATRCNKEHHPEQNTRRNNEKSSQFRLWRKVQLLFGISDHSKARRTSCTQGVGAHK